MATAAGNDLPLSRLEYRMVKLKNSLNFTRFEFCQNLDIFIVRVSYFIPESNMKRIGLSSNFGKLPKFVKILNFFFNSQIENWKKALHRIQALGMLHHRPSSLSLPYSFSLRHTQPAVHNNSIENKRAHRLACQSNFITTASYKRI